MQDLISIIIPVYNVNPYLHDCLKSVMNQTYKNLEILLIDDGSTDGSAEICDEYAKKDLRIKVIHKANGGVSSARNVGIDNTSGKYILFVDADDTVSISYVENLIYPLYENVDISIDIPTFVFPNKKIHYNIREEKYGINIFKDYHLLLQSEYSLALQSPCAKVYKTEILRKHKLRFQIGIKYGEDTIFNLIYYSYIKTYKLISEYSYFYFQRKGVGAVNTFNVCRINEEIKGLRAKKKILMEYRYFHYKAIYNQMIINAMRATLNSLYSSNTSLIYKIKYGKKIIIDFGKEVDEQIFTFRKKQYVVLFFSKNSIWIPIIIYYFVKSII